MIAPIKLNNKNVAADLDKLDPSQREAVESEDKNIVIKAPAGSGKTSSLLTAIADYRYKYLNDRICAITYTRAARAEMESRLQELGIFDVEVSTIHVWARNWLEKLAKKHGLKIHLLTEKEIKDILREITKKYLLHSRITSVNIDILYNYINGSKKMDIKDNYRRTLNALEKRYLAYKRENVLYDFSDLPLYLYDVMIAYDEYITDIDALFVDEFQDVDTVQLDLFDRVLNTKKKFFIGDAWQSIYIFRSADGEAFNKLDNFTLYKLKYNYRSYQEIIDYATTIYEKLESKARDEVKGQYISSIMYSNPSKIKCVKGYGGEVIVVNPWNDICKFNGQEVVKISSRDVNNVLRDFLKKNTPMILCRTNKQVQSVLDNSFYNAETIHQAKGLEYDSTIVIDTSIDNLEDLNVAYVALTRAKNSMLIVNWSTFENYLMRAKQDLTRGIWLEDLI